MSTVLKCTPFCSPCNKGYKHHELLIALLNTDANSTSKENEHDELAKVIKKYEASGWDKNSVIMDKNEGFRFPMLHWACVLGKPRTVRWLLDNGFSPTVRCHDTKETALHRALITLPDLIARNSRGPRIFTTLLPFLRECLGIGDQCQDTPLHIAAKFMVRNKSFNLYENLLVAMVTELQIMSERDRSTIVNSLNNTGDTPLHILAASNKSLYAMQTLMDAGADPLLVNNLSISPLDVAIQNGTVRIINLLKRALLEGCQKSITSVSVNIGDAQNEEIKIRRSERRSSSLVTWNTGSDDFTETGSADQLSSCNSSLSTNSVKSSPQKEDSTKRSGYSAQTRRTSQSSLCAETDFPTVTSSSVVEVKDEPETFCECLEECTIDITNEGEEDDSPLEPRMSENNDVPILHVMKQAGLLPSLNDAIAKAKEEHLSRMKVLEKSLKETEEELGKQNEKEKSIQRDIDNKKKELEKLAGQLHKLKKSKEEIGTKRKLLEDESGDLKKKLLCCETLLRTVPKDSAD